MGGGGEKRDPGGGGERRFPHGNGGDGGGERARLFTDPGKPPISVGIRRCDPIRPFRRDGIGGPGTARGLQHRGLRQRLLTGLRPPARRARVRGGDGARRRGGGSAEPRRVVGHHVFALPGSLRPVTVPAAGVPRPRHDVATRGEEEGTAPRRAALRLRRRSHAAVRQRLLLLGRRREPGAAPYSARAAVPALPGRRRAAPSTVVSRRARADPSLHWDRGALLRLGHHLPARRARPHPHAGVAALAAWSRAEQLGYVPRAAWSGLAAAASRG